MADYNGCFRTNYFAVTDVERLKWLVDEINAELFIPKEGSELYGFGGDNFSTTIEVEISAPSDDIYESKELDLIEELQKIITPGDAVVIMEAGHEKLRYVSGQALVITPDKVESIDVMTWAGNKYKELTGNTTQLSY